MAEYSRLASGQVVSTGGQTLVITPFIPDFIEISNKDAAQEGSGVYRAWWNTDMGQGSAFLESASTGSGGNYGYVYALIPQTVQAWTLGGYVQGGFSTVQFDAVGPLSGVTAPLASGNIVVANAGTYLVSFGASGTASNQFAIFVNGVPQQSTVLGSGAGTQEGTLNAILTLPAGAVINLVNYVTAGATGLASVVGGTQPNVTANVTITQVGAAGRNTVGYIDVIGGTSSAGLVNGTGFTTIQAALSLQFGPVYQHTGSTDFSISKASSAVITTTTAHNLVTGNWIQFSNLAETSTTGMQQIAGIPFMVTVLSPTTFSINWNTNQSNYTIFDSSTSSNNIGSFKQILYPVLYAPGVSFISSIALGATTTITTTAPHNFVQGQEVAFRIPSIWGTKELNSLPNLVIPGSPIYSYVTSVPNSTTFVVNTNSTAFTAFNNNILFLSYPGLKYPQVVAVGDVNTGGLPYSGGQLYPSPKIFNGYTSSTTVGTNTINGPAIQGAFINGTFMGFIIGSGVSGDGPDRDVPGDVLYWRAYMSDLNLP